MKEDFLAYCWQFQLFNTRDLYTTSGYKITIIKKGSQNHSSGPDVQDAHIKIGDTLWVGTVEFHLNASDWNKHQHQIDSAYDNVILHVVYNADERIYNSKNQAIATLELKNYVAQTLINNYQKSFSSKISFIPCEKNIQLFPTTNYFPIFYTRLWIERFEQKITKLFMLLDNSELFWEKILFEELAKYLGAKVNHSAIEIWLKSFSFDLVLKNSFDQTSLTALFLGQAGFLDTEIKDDYMQKLYNQYQYLACKYQLEACKSSVFKFFGVRPPNYPSIRLVQLASIYAKHQNLMSKILSLEKLTDFYNLFTLSPDEYWSHHYHLGKKSKHVHASILSTKTIDLLLINVILPLKFAYLKQQDLAEIDSIEMILSEIKPEANQIIKQYQSIGLKCNSAKDSQALLQLKKNYCALQKCLSCEIGHYVLTQFK